VREVFAVPGIDEASNEVDKGEHAELLGGPVSGPQSSCAASAAEEGCGQAEATQG